MLIVKVLEGVELWPLPGAGSSHLSQLLSGSSNSQLFAEGDYDSLIYYDDTISASYKLF